MSNRIAIELALGTNPVPVTVTLEPGGPLVGDRVMFGTAPTL
ncbi:MAG: hypothetical protein ACE5KA_00455 [Nitrososphaerales archaeon]